MNSEELVKSMAERFNVVMDADGCAHVAAVQAMEDFFSSGVYVPLPELKTAVEYLAAEVVRHKSIYDVALNSADSVTYGQAIERILQLGYWCLAFVQRKQSPEETFNDGSARGTFYEALQEGDVYYHYTGGMSYETVVLEGSGRYGTGVNILLGVHDVSLTDRSTVLCVTKYYQDLDANVKEAAWSRVVASV